MALITRQDLASGIAVISLNRPEALNALSPNLFVELRREIDQISTALDTIGCVILRGEGRSFSAGNDLKAIQAGERPPTPHFQAETLDAIERLPQPVIAAVQGHCYTGSLELALACDLMITGESAKIADTHGKWGMSPTWGMSQRLPAYWIDSSQRVDVLWPNHRRPRGSPNRSRQSMRPRRAFTERGNRYGRIFLSKLLAHLAS